MIADLIVTLFVIFAPADQFPWQGVWDVGSDRGYLVIEQKIVLPPPPPAETEASAIVTALPPPVVIPVAWEIQFHFCERTTLEELGTCARTNEIGAKCRMVQEGLMCDGEDPLLFRAQIRALNESKILFSFQDLFNHGILEGVRVSHDVPLFNE